MTDLLRLPNLAFVQQYEDDGSLIIEAKTKNLKLTSPSASARAATSRDWRIMPAAR